jgi:hypothetical protein
MANYTGSSAFTIPRPIRIKDGVNKETIAGTKTLTYVDSQVQAITPSGGSRTIVLPALKDGAYFTIVNLDTTHALDVNTPAGAKIVTLAANNTGSPAASGVQCFCDGSVWIGIHITCSMAFSA